MVQPGSNQRPEFTTAVAAFPTANRSLVSVSIFSRYTIKLPTSFRERNVEAVFSNF